MQRFGFQPAKPMPMPKVGPASDTPHLDAGLAVVVKAVTAAFAERGIEPPTREELHAIAIATTTASTAALRAAIETVVELRAVAK